jgi:hypothetical protein
MVRITWETLCVLEFQADLFILVDFDDESLWLPSNSSILIFQLDLQLISWHQSNVVFIWVNEVSISLLSDAPVKSHLDISLCLRFFELLVIISFKFNQGIKSALVLLGISISQ